MSLPKIDDVLIQILERLYEAGPFSLDETYAEKLFNLRLIDYEVGYKWKINMNGIDYLASQNNEKS